VSSITKKILGEGYICDEEKLRLLVEEWSDKLGISNWFIITKLLRKFYMPEVNPVGCVKCDLNTERAVIMMVDPIDYPDSAKELIKYDMEVTLVHELLHIMTDYFACEIPKDSLAYKHLEAIITRLSELLVAMNRKIEQLEKK